MTAMTVFVLLIILFCIYTVLDGFDIGTGIALPFLNAEHKREALSAIWPFWDGNEVWGIMGGAVLFAGFPAAYAAALPLLYVPLIGIIAALIIRAAVFEVRFHDEERAALWEWMFTIASAVIAASFGFAFGAVLAGIPADPQGNLTIDISLILSPLPWIGAVLSFAALFMQGLSFSALKGKRALKDVAITLALKVWHLYAAGWVLFAAAVFILNANALGSVPVITALLVSASLGLLRYYLKTRNESLIISYSGISLCLLWLFTASANYPYMIAPAKGSAGLTVAQGASSATTLTPLIILLIVGILGVGSYTIFVYSLFKGTPVKEDKY